MHGISVGTAVGTPVGVLVGTDVGIMVGTASGHVLQESRQFANISARSVRSESLHFPCRAISLHKSGGESPQIVGTVVGTVVGTPVGMSVGAVGAALGSGVMSTHVPQDNAHS